MFNEDQNDDCTFQIQIPAITTQKKPFFALDAEHEAAEERRYLEEGSKPLTAANSTGSR
jgi:hypothetical protein